MEDGLDKAKSAFSQLDAQMSQSTQTATKIGDRLHVRHFALRHTSCLACFMPNLPPLCQCWSW